MAATTPFNGIRKGVSRTVLITGVSRGLGRALALEMAKRGHTVIGCSRTQDKLTSLQSELPNPDHHLFLNVDIVSTLSASSFIHSFNCYCVKLYEYNSEWNFNFLSKRIIFLIIYNCLFISILLFTTEQGKLIFLSIKIEQNL